MSTPVLIYDRKPDARREFVNRLIELNAAIHTWREIHHRRKQPKVKLCAFYGDTILAWVGEVDHAMD